MESGHRWERLFADLEAQVAAEELRERDLEIADRTRRERALTTLGGRLAAHRGELVDLHLVAGIRVHGRLIDLGADWLALAPTPHRAVLVPLSAVVGVGGLGPRTFEGGSARRFALGSALREISRDRRRVQVLDTAGKATEGTIDVVGADFVDLAEHPRDEARRGDNVRAARTIPFAAIACVHSE